MSVIGNSVFVIDGQSIRRIDLSDPENLSVSTLAGDRNSFGTTNAPNAPDLSLDSEIPKESRPMGFHFIFQTPAAAAFARLLLSPEQSPH
jgi:hypothetical protein